MNNTDKGQSGGVNAGKGNRAVASHIKNLHAASKMSGSVSGSAKPAMSKSPGAPVSVLKKPKRSFSKIMD